MAVLDWLQQLLGGGDPEAEGAAQASTAMQPLTQPWLDRVLSGEMARQGLDYYNQNPAEAALGFTGGGLSVYPKITVPRPIGRSEPPFKVTTQGDPNVGQADSWLFFDKFERPMMREQGNLEYDVLPQRLQDPYNLAAEKRQAQIRQHALINMLRRYGLTP